MRGAVLITRAHAQGERTASRFASAGYAVTHIPCIELSAPPDPAAFAAAAARIGSYDWVVITSQNGVNRLRAENPGPLPKIAAVGIETARAVHAAFGREPDLIPASYRGEALVAELLVALGPAPRRIALIRAARGRSVIPDAIRAAGHHLDLVVAYVVGPARAEAERIAGWLRAHAADTPPATIVFASSLTVECFFELAPSHRATAYRYACISPITTQALLAHGVTAAVTATEHTLDGLFRAIEAAAPAM